MKNWMKCVLYVLMAVAYFILFYVCYMITLFSNMEALVLGCMAVGVTVVQYFENEKKDR